MSNLSFAGGSFGATYTVPGSHTGYDSSWQYPGSFDDRIRSTFFSQMVDNGVITTPTRIEMVITFGAGSTSEVGPIFIDTSRTGCSFLYTSSGVFIRKEVAGSGGATIVASAPHGMIDGNQYTLFAEIDPATGNISTGVDGVTKSSGSYTDVLSGLRGGMQHYNDGNAYAIKSLNVNPVAAATSIDTVTTDGNPGFVVGEPFTYTKTGLGTVTGFTVKTAATPAAITSAINLAAGAGELKYWEDGVYYPFAGTVIAEGDDGTLTGTGSFTLSIPADQADVVFNTVETTDNTYLGNKLLAIGHPLENDDLGYYPPADGVVISPNSGVSSAIGATTFVLWVHKVSGIIERYDVVINDAGEITDVTGITSRGITSRGLSSRNISKRGLG